MEKAIADNLQMMNDIRDTYMFYLENGSSPKKACLKCLESFSKNLATFELTPLVWYAIADAQCDMNACNTFVLKKCKCIIKSKVVPSKYEIELLSRLKSVPIIKEESLGVCPWNNGDVYLYSAKVNEVSHDILIRKIGECLFYTRVVPVVTFQYQNKKNQLLSLEEKMALPYIRTMEFPILPIQEFLPPNWRELNKEELVESFQKEQKTLNLSNNKRVLDVYRASLWIDRGCQSKLIYDTSSSQWTMPQPEYIPFYEVEYPVFSFGDRMAVKVDKLVADWIKGANSKA